MSITKLAPGVYKVSVARRIRGKPTKRKATVHSKSEALRMEVQLLQELTVADTSEPVEETEPSSSLTLTGTSTSSVSTFSQGVDLFLQNRHERGKISQKHERMVLHLRKELGDVRLDGFADHFAQYRKMLMKTPTTFGKPRGSASINRYTAIVRAVFSLLVGLEILVRNPITTVKFPKLKETDRDRVLTPEEKQRLLTVIDTYHPHVGSIVRYMLAVPCRTGELLGAGREQYSPITNTIFIPKSKAGIPIVKPIPPSMVSYFRGIPDESPWLFFYSTNKGKYRPITQTVLRKAWEACLRRAGIVDYHVHDLRHEAVTGLYRMRNSDLDIAAVAGWIPKVSATVAMIPKYAHIDKVEAAQRIIFPLEYCDTGKA